VSGQQHACKRKEGRERERKEGKRKKEIEKERKKERERKLTTCKSKGKVIPLKVRRGPEGG